MSRILDGRQIAAQIQQDLKGKLDEIRSAGVTLTLSVVLVGDNPASAIYVRNKQRLADKLGLRSQLIRLPETASESTLISEIEKLNRDASVDGILVQLPLPANIDEQKVLQTILPEKDVDGFHPINAGRGFLGISTVWPCTPSGIMEMFQRENIQVAGKRAVVVGRSNIVGKPMAMMLLAANATVTVCHSKTEDLPLVTRQADILVVAAGKPLLITDTYIQPGVVVVDVGMNRLNGKLVGDVDFERVVEKAGAITPVPGGVGPLTVTMLISNTILLGRTRRGIGGMSK